MRYAAGMACMALGFILGNVAGWSPFVAAQQTDKPKWEWALKSPYVLIMPGCECEKCKAKSNPRTVLVGVIVRESDGMTVGRIAAEEFVGDDVPAAMLDPERLPNNPNVNKNKHLFCSVPEFPKRFKEYKEKLKN